MMMAVVAVPRGLNKTFTFLFWRLSKRGVVELIQAIFSLTKQHDRRLTLRHLLEIFLVVFFPLLRCLDGCLVHGFDAFIHLLDLLVDCTYHFRKLLGIGLKFGLLLFSGLLLGIGLLQFVLAPGLL